MAISHHPPRHIKRAGEQGLSARKPARKKVTPSPADLALIEAYENGQK
jgi:hypothetical protein